MFLLCAWVTVGKLILLTARHHACESTGNYVMEGVLEELCRESLDDFEIVAVPFMDYDGVIQGRPGKIPPSLGSQPRLYAAKRKAGMLPCAPCGRLPQRKRCTGVLISILRGTAAGSTIVCLSPQKHYETQKATIRFANLFEQATTENSLPYEAKNTYPPDTDWNRRGTDCFGTYMFATAGAELAFALETPYFDCSGTPFFPAARP